MTEQEWLVCSDPRPMLEFLRGKTSDRKLRLFACACWRRLLRFPAEKKRLRRAVGIGEHFSDRIATHDEVVAVNRALVAGNEPHILAISSDASDYAIATAYHIAVKFGHYVPLTEYDGGISRGGVVFCHGSVAAELKQQTLILREIIGDPFRPIALKPAWRTPTVVQLARSLYEERRFVDMPVLADALE